MAQEVGYSKKQLMASMADSHRMIILPGARRQAPPAQRSGAAQFGAHGLVFFAGQEEDGIGTAIGIELSGCNERLNQRPGDGALLEEVTRHSGELVGVWRR